MAKIDEKIRQIREAVYGEEVRESIASGMETMNAQCDEAAAGYATALQTANTAKETADTASANANAKAQLAQTAANSVNEAKTAAVQAAANANASAVKADAATTRATTIAQIVETKLADGAFKGDKGDDGVAAVTSLPQGFFAMSVNSNGDLLMTHNSEEAPPDMKIENGNLIYEFI